MAIEKFECVYYAKPLSDIVCKLKKEDKNIWDKILIVA
jgi:hypothetical protein